MRDAENISDNNDTEDAGSKKRKSIVSDTNEKGRIELSPSRKNQPTSSHRGSVKFGAPLDPSKRHIMPFGRKHGRNYTKMLKMLKQINPTFFISKEKRENFRLDSFEAQFNNPEYKKKVLKSLDKRPEDRTFEDLAFITQYLQTTKFAKNFLKENLQPDGVEQMLVLCGSDMQAAHYPDYTTVFRIGNKPDFFYLVFSGEVEILKPTPKKTRMSGYEYFCHLMKLQKENEEYCFDLTVKENQVEFPIESGDIPLINMIFLAEMLNLIFGGFVYKLSEVLSLCNMTADQIGLDKSQIDEIPYIVSNKEKIKEKLFPFSQDKLSQYYFFQNRNDQRDVTIFVYHNVITMTAGMHFGDTALDSRTTRNATVRTKGETVLLYLDAFSYGQNLQKEKQIIAQKEINYLHQNYFFKDIQTRAFEKKYYSYFIMKDFVKDEVICEENSEVEFVYFIRKGTVCLYSSRSILEIHSLLESLKNKNAKFSKDYQYSLMKTNAVDITKSLLDKKQNKLFLLGNCETIGIESMYFGLPFLVTAVVASEKAKIIKIEVERLKYILSHEYKCMKRLKALTDKKLEIMFKRFFNINDCQIHRMDARNYYNNMDLYNEDPDKSLEKNGSSVSFIKPNMNYTSLKLPAISTKLPSIKKRRAESELISDSEVDKIYFKEDSKAKLGRKGSLLSNNRLENALIRKLKKDLIEMEKQNLIVLSNIKSSMQNSFDSQVNEESKEKQTNQATPGPGNFSFFTQLNQVSPRREEDTSMQQSESQSTKKKVRPRFYIEPLLNQKLKRYEIFNKKNIYEGKSKSNRNIKSDLSTNSSSQLKSIGSSCSVFRYDCANIALERMRKRSQLQHEKWEKYQKMKKDFERKVQIRIQD